MSETTADMVSLCSLHAGAELFAINIEDIREVLGMTLPQHVPLAPRCIAGIIPYHGEILTTLSLRALLGLETSANAGNVIVLDDTGSGEQFGLMVDSLSGVVTMPVSALDANPGLPYARNTTLFDGAFKIPSGWMLRLDPQQLQPSQLTMNRFNIATKQIGKGEPV